jgi:hypothetical protein
MEIKLDKEKIMGLLAIIFAVTIFSGGLTIGFIYGNKIGQAKERREQEFRNIRSRLDKALDKASTDDLVKALSRRDIESLPER